MKKTNANISIPTLSTYTNDYTPYEYPRDVDVILSEIRASEQVFSKRTKKYGSVYYYNVPASLDIEDTSTYVDNGQGKEKISFMYVWQFSVNGKVILGRTWNEFSRLMNKIQNEFTDLSHRLIVYVHYLNHEFSFIRTLTTWEDVFCKNERSPLYAVTDGGIEFRDSYILTGKSLKNSAGDLTKYKVKKLIGDLDYSLIHTSKTPLTDKEKGYCVNDCLVVDSIIREKMEEEGNNIAKIPLTNTGYVRRYIREQCYPRNDKKARSAYFNLMRSLTITPSEYATYKRAFAGGFTHANALYVGEYIRRIVDSMDFTSSYPAVMISEKFPMSKPEIIVTPTLDDFQRALQTTSIFDIRFTNIKQRDNVFENPISSSKCNKIVNGIFNNGRVVKADVIATTITNVDWQYIQQFYTWDEVQICDLYIFDSAYLPKPIVESILYFYQGKTELKGIDSEVVEYMKRKGMLNSSYGCMVTDIVKDEIIYDDEWETAPANAEEELDRYNKSKNRFLYYPWGVFVTAYARRNLFTAIYELGADYIYSDTDSVKFLNYEKHKAYFEKYNENIVKKIDRCLSYYYIDIDKSRPKNSKGVPKQIGVWDWETEGCPYTGFKTLGAKRYMYTQNGKVHVKCAGLAQKDGEKADDGDYIGNDYVTNHKNPYDFFSDNMKIDIDHSGRITHTYIDKPTYGIVKDYQGTYAKVKERTSVHLENSTFSLSLSDEFRNFLSGIKEVTA